jgi:hypothetical protein
MKLTTSQKSNTTPAFGIKLDHSAQKALKEAFIDNKPEINLIEQTLDSLGANDIYIGVSHKKEKVFGAKMEALRRQKTLVKTLVHFYKNSYTDVYETKNFYAYFKGNKKEKLPIFYINWYTKENRVGKTVENHIKNAPEPFKNRLLEINGSIKQALLQHIAQKRFVELNP